MVQTDQVRIPLEATAALPDLRSQKLRCKPTFSGAAAAQEEEVRSTGNQLVAVTRVRMYVRATVIGCLSVLSKSSRGVVESETRDDESATVHEIRYLIASYKCSEALIICTGRGEYETHWTWARLRIIIERRLLFNALTKNMDAFAVTKPPK
jgi:hypothetical protein